MIRQPISRRARTALGTLSVVLLLGGYTIASHCQHLRNPNDKTMPSWRQLGQGIKEAAAVKGWLWQDARATGWRLLLGMVLGTIGAVAIGLAMGCSRTIEALLLPLMAFLAKVPPTAILGVFFVVVGIDLKLYVAMILFGMVPTMGQSVYLAVREVSDEYLYKAYTLGASNAEAVWNVIVRTILPKLIDAFRLAIGPAVVYIIAAEMVQSDVGMGYRIRLQSRLLDMKVVYPYVAMLAAFCFGVDFGLKRLQKALCPWYVPDEGK